MAELEFADTKVVYQSSEDRFHHRIAVRTRDGWTDLLESIEGTSDDPWPVSPPWQQIVRESLGHRGEDVLLGVGLSGNGHWSIAVHPTNPEPGQDQSDPFQGLAFDVACKTSKPASYLGAQWRIAPLWSIPKISDQEIVFVNKSSGYESQVHLFVMHGVAAIHPKSPNAILELRPQSDCSRSQTHRWAMRVETNPRFRTAP